MHRPEIMKRTGQARGPSFSRLATFLTLSFLLAPLVVLVAYSFNASKTFEWTGLTLKWYEKLFSDSPDLWTAFSNSAIVALGSALVSTAIGSLAAIGCSRWAFRIKNYIRAMGFLPMVLPEIIMGVSLTVFFSGLGVGLGLFTVFVAHVCFELPFAFLLVAARMDEFDPSIIEAAYDLGANEVQTLFRVILPCAAPGIASAFLTAVTLSLEDFIITFFVSGPGSSTLPIFVNSAIRYGVSPVINALSAIMIAGTALASVLLRRFIKNIAAK